MGGTSMAIARCWKRFAHSSSVSVTICRTLSGRIGSRSTSRANARSASTMPRMRCTVASMLRAVF
jgi:hypothetical protein